METRLTGGVTVSGGDPGVHDLLAKRSAFIASYCEQKGWDPNSLTFPQVMEIRQQEGWKNPASSA